MVNHVRAEQHAAPASSLRRWAWSRCLTGRIASEDLMSLIKEQLALKDRAESTLASAPSLNGFLLRCHAAVLRAHIDCSSYALFTSQDSDSALALIRSWERRSDDALFDDEDLTITNYPVGMQPTISSWQVPIPRREVEELMSQANRLKVPVLLADVGAGSDGTNHVLSFPHHFLGGTQFRWWQRSWMDDNGVTQDGPPPPGWEALFSTSQRIVQLAGGPVWTGPYTQWDGPPGGAG